MQRKKNQPTVVFILLSVFTHILLLLVLLHKQTPISRPTVTPVEVTYQSPDELAPPNPEKKEKKAQAVPKNQVVEQQKQLNKEIDERSRFLSAFNQKVVQQTKAQRTGKFENTAQGGAREEGVKTGSKDSLEVQANKKTKTTTRQKGELPQLKDLTPKFAIDTRPKAPEAPENGRPSQNDDYLKDVKTGMQTLLSTREFIYYAYYARIKEALRQHWEPTVRERVKIIYRQGRNIASARDRITQVLVTLDAKGELLHIEVLGQSGVEALDSAAVDAFRAASPFPNPPRGMIEPDGTIKIRWDFVLEA